MAISSPAPPTFSTPFCCRRTDSKPHFPPFSSVHFTPSNRTTSRPPTCLRLRVSVRLNSSNPSGAGGYASPENGDLSYELQHGFAPQQRKGSPVFVTLPVDAVSSSGQVKRRKTMMQSFLALAAAGVEGVVMEVWWGVVERDEPRAYDWRGYLEIVALARRCGLKVRAVMAFHQCGTGPDDPSWIPLPLWVLEEIGADPDLAYADRFGRRNMEYISLGCDVLPVLRGRSPIQAYTDFMRSFRDTFRPVLGVTITGVQVGMGPAGELRYPSCPTRKLAWDWHSRELGEFQCYDKYMLASLNACAKRIGMREWGNGGPIGAGNLMQNLEQTDFFRSDGGSWSTPYGKFFLQWYSGMLFRHGKRICREVNTIFRGIEVSTSAKLAALHWHYGTKSHPSELTAGYYNTDTRDGYLPITRMFGRYGITLCCPCFEMQDTDEKQINPASSPESFLRQLLSAAEICDIPLQGENYATTFDERSFNQVLKMSKIYTDGFDKPSFSFNFIRMDKNLFDYRNWVGFTRFVRQISHGNMFRAKLDLGGDKCNSSSLGSSKTGLAFAYC